MYITVILQPVWFCNMDHEKISGWLKFFIAFGSIGVITSENVINYGGTYNICYLKAKNPPDLKDAALIILRSVQHAMNNEMNPKPNMPL